ncbi:1-deoxy-D-xylulose-5-phosphate synthase [Capnocytophaga canimorsus]|uniref:1-deoxy-D-xylulose-5-phosphate synthase n=1 Tax=Capnocytophaga canimorsus TaxID=28188 RepID=A0A0B7HQP1_9FLAO|nr:1-deoxy-D-xylulose-5-phosphate synthase [Capnocytophaga canimorsus]ATA76990.1 1-deoxy-D-xylulose-5-phosphate synthase [Capnocytophaga canimorsus]PJI83878.1 1-deoxy-D-xylulose-5-phosphate synthase [Capnocytophaga canimorsus]CEN40954.1 1-deoxy-D-xylulose-5-phosphate synthase [Capnocytophaga canimorsus]STA72195.1 1-deoxy-D-xylulose-5-phosphate synthase [Capnocytophaga canimorsus]
MFTLLPHIKTPDDLRKLSVEQLPILAQELREFIVDVVSVKEGHLGASLGVVELTIALHYVFNTPKDKLIWDVGHQAYGHKILTSRQKAFQTNRQLNGISGFPKIDESPYDAFGTGHSSTSISAILGMAIASKLAGIDRQHIAVIGDASIVSGMAFEAMNHAGTTQANLLIILNDNTMGIDPSVGALKDYFNQLWQNKNDDFFKTFNIKYQGSIDGHNIPQIITALKHTKNIKGIKLLHLKTTKGKGLKKAEDDQVTYHAPGKFDKITGERHLNFNEQHIKYQDVFGKTLLQLSEKNEKIVAITPAMPSGSSLHFMMEKFPERTFDVGIAEQHAVTFSAGLALEGCIPFCVIYSTFLQRAYDQIIHDVALQNIPVIFCIDRAGLVGEDGATHHGVFDMAFLRPIPNLIIASPRNASQLRNMLYTAQKGLTQPMAIRYPRGVCDITDWNDSLEFIPIGKAMQLKSGSRFAVLSIGSIAENTQKAINSLDNASEFAHFDMRFLKPLDEEILNDIFLNYESIITVEEGSEIGGLGSAIIEFAQKKSYKNKITVIGIPDVFIAHGSVEDLRQEVGLDSQGIAKKLKMLLK